MPAGTSISGRDELSFASGNADATRAFARALGARMRGGEVVALVGPLGAGKTAFVKGLAEGLGYDPKDVVSPTFLLIHEFRRAGCLPLTHVDAYRVSSAEELREEGVEECLGRAGVAAIEWADRVADLLPSDHLLVRIDVTGEETRGFHIRATGPAHAALLAGIREVDP